MPQFFVDKKITPPGEIELIGSDAHHISDVLRLRAGDWIQISDGLGNSFKAEIERTSSKSVKISVKNAVKKATRTRTARIGPLVKAKNLKSPSKNRGAGMSAHHSCRNAGKPAISIKGLGFKK